MKRIMIWWLRRRMNKLKWEKLTHGLRLRRLAIRLANLRGDHWCPFCDVVTVCPCCKEDHR